MKIKIGESPGSDERRDLNRIALARNVIGPDTELYVDANGGYRRKQAIRVAHAMADHDVTWFEEPVSSDDLAGLQEVRDQVSAGCHRRRIRLRPQPISTGCWPPTRSTACRSTSPAVAASPTGFEPRPIAASYSVDVSGHCAPNLHAHVAAAVPNLRHLEYFHDHHRIEHMLFEGALSPEGGRLAARSASSGAGHRVQMPRRRAVPRRVRRVNKFTGDDG